MENFGSNFREYITISPWRSLILIIIYFFIGMFVGQFFGALLAMLLYWESFQDVLTQAMNYQSGPHAKSILYLLQFGSSIGGFIVAPLLYLRKFETAKFSDFLNSRNNILVPIVLTVFITLAFMVVNSILIEWNANVTFPKSLSYLEKVFKEKEEQLQQITEFLTTFSSFGQFLFAFIIIAIIPAVGEELFFRGLIQNKLWRALKNPHVAIWLTAFFFSAFHFQFYGLVPRLFLGAIFGYLYYWSGNLLMPILGHLINNGFSLIMLYLYQQKALDYNVVETKAFPGVVILIFLLLGIAATIVFVRNASAQKQPPI